MIFAVIADDIVTNIIELEPQNAHEFPNAVAVPDIAVFIEDTYADGVFSRNGVVLLTPMQAAEATIADLDAAVLELEYQNALLTLGM